MASKCATSTASVLLKRLREAMKDIRNAVEPVNAFIIPTDDAHMSEYVADFAKRRQYISGFTGSAGTAVITDTHAALWTDGRYWLQAGTELDPSCWAVMRDRLPDTPTIGAWLATHFDTPSKIGADPYLISHKQWEKLAKEIRIGGHVLVPVHTNFVDVVWGDTRPQLPRERINVMPLEYAGRAWHAKVADVAAKMHEKRVFALLVTALDEVAWLLNLRGNDIPYNPVFYSYCIIVLPAPDVVGNEPTNSRQADDPKPPAASDAVKVLLFVDDNKLSDEVRKHLGLSASSNGFEDKKGAFGEQEGVKLVVCPYDSVLQHVEQLVASTATTKNNSIWITETCNHALASRVPDERSLQAVSPIALLKSLKNEAEIAGARRCQLRDGIVLAQYFVWMEKNIDSGNITELSASRKLEELRSQQPHFVSLSFETISASGPNGAVVHYKADETTNRAVTLNDMFLLDSGSQYADGTTDITRTYYFGDNPSERQREMYTRVLRGHIQLAMAKFPNKTTGHRLDMLARKPLWDVGLDYQHGTGHGVGAFLNVHEGPQSISMRYAENDPGLQAGMIVTDEPGYYEAGEYGIRIESDMLVVKCNDIGSAEFLQLDPLTVFPIQTKLVNADLMTRDEITWLNTYHERCRRELLPVFMQQTDLADECRWLESETAPIG